MAWVGGQYDLLVILRIGHEAGREHTLLIF